VERILKEYYDVEVTGIAMMGKVITTHVGPGTAGTGIEIVT
ncbi:MAG: DegV family protein, partial [Thermotogae bacterium]